jgi:hypothetical protein
MKIRKLVVPALLACAPALVSAEQAGEVRVAGERTASQVCKAVMTDDVTKLRMLLRSYRQTLSYGYMFSANHGDLAQDFTCNSQDLRHFSSQIGAQKVSAYFSRDDVAEQSQLAAAGK